MRRAATALAVLSMALAATASAQTFKWDQAKGSTIRVLLNQHPWTTAITPYLPEFEKLTGIKVVTEVFPEAQYRQKVLVELASGTGALDAFMMTPNQEGMLYLRSGWLEPLDAYTKNYKITPTDITMNDFFPATLAAERINGQLVGLPLQQETTMLFYRKDLFEKNRIAVPRTFAQLEAAAKALNKDGMAGIALRGRAAAATSQLAPYMFGFGANWLTGDGKSAFTSEEMNKALTFYSGLLSKYGPPGATTLHWAEVTSLFAQGKAAMFTDGSLFRSVVEDPKTSTVVGKIGFAPFPAGPSGKKTPVVITWGMSIAKASKNKTAAWIFTQWATNKQNQLRVLLKDVPAARRSAWKAPEFVQNDKSPEWTKANLQQLEYANPVWNPPIISVGEVRDILGQAIVSAIQGGDVKAALAKAAADTNVVLDKEK
jgi:multiple sugar transport system substrate-binding protein